MSEQVGQINFAPFVKMVSPGRIVIPACPDAWTKAVFQQCCLELMQEGIEWHTLTGWLKEMKP